ncbi:MAG: hypothetical protein AMXMBFR56_47500 [Polyangiaceae bacterium]
MRARGSLLWVCALLALGCGERPLEPRGPTPGVPHYRFVTYNIAHFTSGDPTLSAVGETNGDVIALQEVDPSWRAQLIERYCAEYPYMLFHAAGGPEGLGVLSRYPLAQGGFLPAPEDWHPAWHTVVQTPSGPIQILNVHLRALFDGSSDPVGSYFNTGDDHVYEMDLFVSALAEDTPTVVLGDFNEGVGGPAIGFLEARGYRNALPLYHPGQPTWRAPSVANQMQMTIDHILFDGAFEPLDSFVLDRGASDHLPVVAHLELPGAVAHSRSPVR